MNSECRIDKYGTKWWYKPGTDILHREDGPAVEWSNGNKYWYIEGKLHRIDGPAAEYPDGIKEWFIEGRRHRIDGPAIEYSDGYKAWFIEGKRHRIDGPAIEYSSGKKAWWIEGRYYRTKEEWCDALMQNSKKKSGLGFRLKRSEARRCANLFLTIYVCLFI